MWPWNIGTSLQWSLFWKQLPNRSDRWALVLLHCKDTRRKANRRVDQCNISAGIFEINPFHPSWLDHGHCKAGEEPVQSWAAQNSAKHRIAISQPAELLFRAVSPLCSKLLHLHPPFPCFCNEFLQLSALLSLQPLFLSGLCRGSFFIWVLLAVLKLFG